jgi:uncharacterized membrane protein YdjX (TVP38/TMEM64 family)
MAKKGVGYPFTLRLVTLFLFFLINLLMGLTPIRTLSYYLVSQVGMLAGMPASSISGRWKSSITTA